MIIGRDTYSCLWAFFAFSFVVFGCARDITIDNTNLSCGDEERSYYVARDTVTDEEYLILYRIKYCRESSRHSIEASQKIIFPASTQVAGITLVYSSLHGVKAVKIEGHEFTLNENMKPRNPSFAPVMGNSRRALWPYLLALIDSDVDIIQTYRSSDSIVVYYPSGGYLVNSFLDFIKMDGADGDRLTPKE